MKIALLESVPAGVVTWTQPVVAPLGTMALICFFETTVKFAGVPLKVTLVVPVRLVPKIPICVPGLPKAGVGSTNGLSPMERPNMVPQLCIWH